MVSLGSFQVQVSLYHPGYQHNVSQLVWGVSQVSVPGVSEHATMQVMEKYIVFLLYFIK